jgi:hypothetical protein
MEQLKHRLHDRSSSINAGNANVLHNT